MRKPKHGTSSRPAQTNKYDAHHSALQDAYGAFADLRRELADSKTAVAERTELLNLFAECAGLPARLAAARGLLRESSRSPERDFAGNDWWPRLLARPRQGPPRGNRPSLPAGEPAPAPPSSPAYANFETPRRDRTRGAGTAAHPGARRMDAPPAASSTSMPPGPGSAVARQGRPAPRPTPACTISRSSSSSSAPAPARSPAPWPNSSSSPPAPCTNRNCSLPGTGTSSSGSPTCTAGRPRNGEPLRLRGPRPPPVAGALGQSPLDRMGGQAGERLLRRATGRDSCRTSPDGDSTSTFTQRLAAAGGEELRPRTKSRFFAGHPPLVAVHQTIYLSAERAAARGARSLARQRPASPSANSATASSPICARPASGTRRRSGTASASPTPPDRSSPSSSRMTPSGSACWPSASATRAAGNGTAMNGSAPNRAASRADKPEILDDPRLDAATPVAAPAGLVHPRTRPLDRRRQRQLPRHPRPGLARSPSGGRLPRQRRLPAPVPRTPAARPQDHRPRQRHRLVRRLRRVGTGRPQAHRRPTSNSSPPPTRRFVKLPDSGWVELDLGAVQKAHETMADIGLDGLSALPQKVDLLQACHLDEEGLKRFGDLPEAKALRDRLANFKRRHQRHPARLA